MTLRDLQARAPNEGFFKISFWGPFVKQFVLFYLTIVCLSVCLCLSVCDVDLLWPNG